MNEMCYVNKKRNFCIKNIHTHLGHLLEREKNPFEANFLYFMLLHVEMLISLEQLIDNFMQICPLANGTILAS